MRKPRPITGSVQPLTGWYYAVINMYVDGKRKQDWMNTGIKSTGSKRKAAQFLQEELVRRNEEKNKSQRLKDVTTDMLFVDYLHMWLKTKRTKIEAITYNGYENRIDNWIKRYFSPINARLSTLEPSDFEDFYNSIYDDGASGTTALYYHRLMKQALSYAVKKDILLYNVMDKVDAPKKNNFVAKHYSREEALELLEIAKDDPIYLPILLSTYYGLRWSEVLGLRWESIDFEANTITIEHTVTVANIDGKHVIIANDTTKTKASFRTLPLVPSFRAKLLEVKAEQEHNRKLCGKSYNKAESQYIYTDALGNRTKPNYLTSAFPEFMVKNGFRRLRFHDLRHSCASLLLASGVPLKQIQEWLGHSDFAITANTYAHLEFNSKLASASAMTWIDKTSMGQGQKNVVGNSHEVSPSTGFGISEKPVFA